MGTEPYLTFTPKPKHGAKCHFEWDDRDGDLRRILPTWLTKAMNTTMLNAAIKLIDSVPNQEPRTIPAERATLGSIPIRRFCVQKTCSGRPRATTPAEDRFLALSARRRRTTTVPQLVADHFASGRRISATTVRNRLHNRSVCKKTSCVRSPQRTTAKEPLMLEHVSWTQQQWASVLFTDESRFTMESDSGRLLI
ncbi:HTH_Tnp_Tc3_2 domain-containing protein [Trichonephila clavipes]|nr:HTH_Tnp_Tc3_2 domain-containing protein [Trichonephila clavipes]